jgi:hypothetical protein
MASKIIRIEVTGLKEAVRRLQELGDRAPEAASTLLSNFMNTRVVTPAKDEYVPVDTGALRSTIQASEPLIAGTKITGVVSAGSDAAKYALKVHENPRSGQTGGVSPSGKKYTHWARSGQWKYLEVPALAAAQNSASWLAAEARALLRTMGGK